MEKTIGKEQHEREKIIQDISKRKTVAKIVTYHVEY